jgi:hypothetical protein
VSAARRPRDRTTAVVVAFIVAKSVLASRQAKDLVERRLGARARNGLYRPLYILFSGVGAVLIVRKVYQGPHRVLYEVRPPFSWLMRAGQAACVVATMEATRVIGPGFFGAPQLKAFVGGGDPVAEPEAQGPGLEPDGELSSRTVFGLTRHPNNWFPTSIFLLEPKMTDKRAAFCALVALHGLVGSVHEEYRLKRAYGDAPYRRYMGKAPFLFGRRRP